MSRKRKAWEGVPTGGTKYIGSGRLPAARGADEPDEEEEEAGLGILTKTPWRQDFFFHFKTCLLPR